MPSDVVIVVPDSPAPTEIDLPTPPCTPTEIEPDDDPEDAFLPVSVFPYLRWTNMKDRVRRCLPRFTPTCGFSSSHEVVFELAAPGEAWQHHLDFVLDSNLCRRGFECFKFGITYWPHTRFNRHDYIRLRRMVVSLVTENCDFTAKAEKSAIARYRSDPRCKNISPGGESHDHGPSPHFLYIVFGSERQFPSRRNRRKRKRSESVDVDSDSHSYQPPPPFPPLPPLPGWL